MHDLDHAIQIRVVTYLAQNNIVHNFLRPSKTDQEVKGSTISLTSTLLHICPVYIVLSFMQASNPGTFFATFLVDQSLGTCTKSHQFLILIEIGQQIIQTSFVSHWSSI